jgi:uncharacterized small protein (DUF1192 family)
MDLEELEPRRKPAVVKELDSLSIGELKDYIAELEAEIARVKAKIAAKEAHLTGAGSLFKQG